MGGGHHGAAVAKPWDMERRAAILGAFLGDSKVVQQLRLRASMVACESGPVLVWGEQGTGKRLLAWLLHRAGRMGRPFVPIAAASLETSAIPGLFDNAGNGTLLLEEVEQARPSVQQALAVRLRERVAGRFPLQARVLSTCSAEPFLLCERGLLDPVLYQAVAGTLLVVPPLRERPADRSILAEHFLRQNREVGYGELRFSEEALELVETLELRGNAAELRCLVMRVGVLRRAGLIGAEDVIRALSLEGEPGWRRARAEAMREFARSYLGAILADSLGGSSVAGGSAAADGGPKDLPTPLREFVRLWRDGVRELRGEAGIEGALAYAASGLGRRNLDNDH